MPASSRLLHPPYRLQALLCMLTSLGCASAQTAPAALPPLAAAAITPAAAGTAPAAAGTAPAAAGITPAAAGITPPAARPALELPVLVVDHQHRPVDDVRLDQVRVKTGTGASFTPTAMRKQGDDPLALAILLDASRDSWHDLHEIDADLAALVGSQLLPNDRVTLYAADCTMTRSLRDATPEAALLRKGVEDAITYPNLHGGAKNSACGKTMHLWDDVAIAVAALAKEPGRRILLLVSSGADGGSKYDSEAVREYAFDHGVAIFGLRDQRQADADNYQAGSLSTSHNFGNQTITPQVASRNANALELLCANDGGIALVTTPAFRKDAIADLLFLIRNRMIFTIARDIYQPGPTHSVKVSQTPITSYFMSATGALEPLEAK